MKLNELFNFHNAKSGAFEDHETGEIPFVTNGFRDNGIIGFVKPNKNDRVFNFEGLCISAFCETTVQKPPFLARGNGGSGLTVLEPKSRLTFNQLTQIAGEINLRHSWRFSYGRMAITDRLVDLTIGLESQIKLKKKISDLLPKPSKRVVITKTPEFKEFNVTQLFELGRGDFHALDRLEEGKYPTVSRVAEDNGIVGYFKKPADALIYPKGTITVATTTGDAFVQLDDFICTDNIVILKPKVELTQEDLFFIASMITREKWRVSYGRQCYKTIFAKTNINLPVTPEGNLDKDYIKEVVSKAYHFNDVQVYLRN
jgi:hypothetical protein